MHWIDSLKVKVKMELLSRVLLFVIPWTAAHQLLHPWNFPGKSTGVGCHFLLQGIFLTQGSNWSPALQADTWLSESPGKPFRLMRKPHSFGEYLFSICILQEKYEIHAQCGFIIFILLTWSIKKQVVCVCVCVCVCNKHLLTLSVL